MYRVCLLAFSLVCNGLYSNLSNSLARAVVTLVKAATVNVDRSLEMRVHVAV